MGKKEVILMLCAAALMLVNCSHSNAGGTKLPEDSQPFTGEAEIRQSWQGDYPVAQIERLPEGQRDRALGYINDAGTFEQIWRIFMPGEPVPQIDFRTRLVVYARNTQFYNRTSIGKVNVTDGMAEVLAMETMSARPIEDKVAMSLAVITRQGIVGLKIGDKALLIYK